MKKTIALLFMLSLIVSLCCVSAFAAETSKIAYKASDLEVNPGDTITVDVEFSGFANAKSYIISAKFDSDSIKLKNDPEPLYSHFFFEFDPEYVEFMAGFREGTALNQDFVRYTFVVSDDVKPGSTITINFTTEMQFEGGATLDTSIPQNPVVLTVICPHTNKTSVAAVPATCASAGTKAHEKCSACGKLLLNGNEVTEAEIRTPKDPANHDGGTEKRNEEPATEEKGGYTGDTYCLGCNQIIEKGIKTPPLDHTHSMTHTAPIAPDCTNNGVLEHWTCSKCDKIYADEAGTVELESTVDPKLGHKTEVKGSKEANCTEAGYTGDEICTVCNETVVKGEEIPPKGHMTEKVGVKEAKCSEAGYTGDEVCTVCNETITEGEVIPPTDEHVEEVINDKQADCSNEGYTGDTYCKVCGKKLKDGEVIPPDDTFHKSMEHHEEVAATCVAVGNIEYWHCTDCNKNYSDEAGTLVKEDTVLPIDPENHVNTETRNASSATCSNEGYTGDKYCTDCDTLISSGNTTPIDPDAHSYVNNRCEYCGKELAVVNYPTGYIYIDNENHLSGPVLARHIPDSLTMHTDGVYEWSFCIYCEHEYNKTKINKSDDTVDLTVDDPVESDNPESVEEPNDETVNVPEVTETDKDNNPPTGIAIALLPMIVAAAAAIASKKTNR